LCEEAIQIGYAQIEHIRLSGAAEFFVFGRVSGPNLVFGDPIGEIEYGAKTAAEIIDAKCEVVTIPVRESSGITCADEIAAQTEDFVSAWEAETRGDDKVGDGRKSNEVGKGRHDLYYKVLCNCKKKKL
jgi:hypothetical protein